MPKRTNKNSGKIVIENKKIGLLYNKELEMIDNLPDNKFQQLEDKINSSEAIENEEILERLISEIVKSERYIPKKEELDKIARTVLPKTNKSVNKCLGMYDTVEEVKGTYGDTRYVVTKGSNKYYVKIRSLWFYSKESFNSLIESMDLVKKASKLGLTINVHDIFICRDKDGQNKVFIVSDHIDGENLSDWTEKNKLTENHKKSIKKLINTFFDNNIILGYISTDKIMVQKNGKFILTSISNASSAANLIQKKKTSALTELKWISSKSSDKLSNLAIRKIIREKKITLN